MNTILQEREEDRKRESHKKQAFSRSTITGSGFLFMLFNTGLALVALQKAQGGPQPQNTNPGAFSSQDTKNGATFFLTFVRNYDSTFLRIMGAVMGC